MSRNHEERIKVQRQIERRRIYANIAGFLFFLSGAVLLVCVAFIAMTHWSRDFDITVKTIGLTAGAFISMLVFGSLQSDIQEKISQGQAYLDHLRRRTT